MPSAEDYYEAKYHFQGCIPDFPTPLTWGTGTTGTTSFFITKYN